MSTTHSSFDQYCISYKTISHQAAAAPGTEVRRECPWRNFQLCPSSQQILATPLCLYRSFPCLPFFTIAATFDWNVWGRALCAREILCEMCFVVLSFCIELKEWTRVVLVCMWKLVKRCCVSCWLHPKHSPPLSPRIEYIECIC